MGNGGWALEVIRGREVGRSFPLPAGRSTLGNALGGEPGIDLGPQEGDSPRRMAARQARVDCSGGVVWLADLDSPGGTFVNSQRVLPGQATQLQPGDVVQLGGVQLRVARGGPKPQAKPVGPLTNPFRLATGATCRTWDDFRTVSAQHWGALREELTSGRLGSFLASSGQGALAPPASGTPDERLDSWLAALPASKPAEPAMEVHPATLHVKAVAGGGTVRKTVVVTNVGYRLLRSTVRVEPNGGASVAVAPGFAPGPFLTAEQTEIPVDITVPEDVRRPLTAAVIVEGNGGLKRVEVRVEPPPTTEAVPEPSGRVEALPLARVVDRLAGLSPGRRAALAALAAVVFRLVLELGDRLAGAATVPAAARPDLGGAAVLLGTAGALMAGRGAWRRGERAGIPTAAFAGAFAGTLAAALAVALCRCLEPAAVRAGSAAFPLAYWTALGGLAGAALAFGLAPRSDAAGPGGGEALP